MSFIFEDRWGHNLKGSLKRSYNESFSRWANEAI